MQQSWVRVSLFACLVGCGATGDVGDAPREVEVYVDCELGSAHDGAGGCEPCPTAENGTACNEAGTCVWNDTREEAECVCALGWKGDECEDFEVCELEPCGEHGDCEPLDVLGAYTCTCEVGFGGNTCEACPPEPVTTRCDEGAECGLAEDGDERSQFSISCAVPSDLSDEFCVEVRACPTEDPCIRDFDLHVSLLTETAVSRVWVLSDWWTKRPDVVEIWVSSDPSMGPDNGATLAGTVSAQRSPWQCVDGEPCTDDVPDTCCPNGRDEDQDLSDLDGPFAKWDILEVTPTVGDEVWVRVVNTQQPAELVLHEVFVEGSECLGDE